MPALLLLILLFAGQTQAAGNQLVRSRAQNVADEAAIRRITANNPDIVKVYPVAIDAGVFGSNVVIVTIDGRERKFIGSMVNTTPEGHWVGKEGVISKGGAKLDLVKQANGVVFGQVTTTDFFYEITNVWGPEVMMKNYYGRHRGGMKYVDDPRDKDPRCDLARVIEDDEVSKLIKTVHDKDSYGNPMVNCTYEFRCRTSESTTNGDWCPPEQPPNRWLH